MGSCDYNKSLGMDFKNKHRLVFISLFLISFAMFCLYFGYVEYENFIEAKTYVEKLKIILICTFISLAGPLGTYLSNRYFSKKKENT